MGWKVRGMEGRNKGGWEGVREGGSEEQKAYG